mgnify:CR=1 FL=1
MAERKSTPAPRWKVSVVPPRKSARERHWQLRAWKRLPGGAVEEHRESSNTDDRARAEELARQHELDLNRGGAPGTDWTVLEVSEARAQALEAEGRPQAARKLRKAAERVGLFATTPDRELDARAVLRARDALIADGLATRSAKVVLRLLMAAWRWAEERGHVRTPWPKVSKLRCPATRKRPYTDGEVAALLTWVESYKGGKWAPLFHLLADTGRRVGELVRLRGRDVRREAGVIELGRTKTGEVARVPVPAETMALLPQVEGEAFLWPAQARVNRGAGPGHTSNGAVRAVLRRGLEAIKVPDPERLDTHSLRRAFVATAERAGVATDVGRRVTGHATRAMWDHYQAQAVGDDLHQVVEVVREQRSKVGPASHKPPTAEPSEALESARKSKPAKVAAGAAAQIDFFIR